MNEAVRQIETEVRQQQQLHELEPTGLAANRGLDALRNHQGARKAERQASADRAELNEGPGYDDVERVDAKTRSKGSLVPMKREELFERYEDQREGGEQLEFSDGHGRS